MRSVAVSPDVYAVLHRLALTYQLTPAQVLAAIVTPPGVAESRSDLIVNVLLQPEFHAQLGDERYVSILTWLAHRHASEFGYYLRRDPRSRRYITATPDELRRFRRERITRPLSGTRYWAVLNLRSGGKRRFLRRLLGYIGYQSPLVDVVCSAAGLPQPTTWWSRWSSAGDRRQTC